MQTLVRIIVVSLLILLAVFAASNLEWVQITIPGLQTIQMRLASAAGLFFILGFLTACIWLSAGMLRRHFLIRSLKKRIQELETRLPSNASATTEPAIDKKLL